MNYSKAILFVLSSIVWVSCKQIDPDQKLTVQVTNKTQDNIEFLSISTTKGQGRITSYPIREDATITLAFTFDQVDKTDGSYQISYKSAMSTDTLTKSFGYYTNGYPTEKALLLNVFADSVSVERIPFGSY